MSCLCQDGVVYEYPLRNLCSRANKNGLDGACLFVWSLPVWSKLVTCCCCWALRGTADLARPLLAKSIADPARTLRRHRVSPPCARTLCTTSPGTGLNPPCARAMSGHRVGHKVHKNANRHMYACVISCFMCAVCCSATLHYLYTTKCDQGGPFPPTREKGLPMLIMSSVVAPHVQ